jgi:hypothetical protein
MAVAINGAVDRQGAFGRNEAVGNSVMPSIVETKGSGKGVDTFATTVGNELFATARKIEIGIAVVRALATVIGGELQVYTTSVQRGQVDAYKSPIFPQNVAIDVPTQGGIGNKVSGIAIGIDVGSLLVLEPEGKSGLVGGVVEWVLQHSGIFHGKEVVERGIDIVGVCDAFSLTAAEPVAETDGSGVTLGDDTQLPSSARVGEERVGTSVHGVARAGIGGAVVDRIGSPERIGKRAVCGGNHARIKVGILDAWGGGVTISIEAIEIFAT